MRFGRFRAMVGRLLSCSLPLLLLRLFGRILVVFGAVFAFFGFFAMMLLTFLRLTIFVMITPHLALASLTGALVGIFMVLIVLAILLPVFVRRCFGRIV